jgi:L-amino acid N-acyltransferase YncA
MAEKSIKVDNDLHSQVVAHTINTGQKIGKFYDIAVKEKLERERQTEKVQYEHAGKRMGVFPKID